LLIVREIHKGFGGSSRAPARCVLAGVSLQLSPGEIAVISGANGAGKSTLLKILATLLTPDRGYLQLDGATLDFRSRASTGYATGEERSFQLRLSAAENLRFFAQIHGISSRQSAARLAYLGAELQLESTWHTPIAALSPGMRDRVGVARALLHEPRLVLLDEPTRSQDANGRQLMERVIDERRSAGAIIVLASHDSGLFRRVPRQHLEDGQLGAEPASCVG
jgi:ABC-type multidrug transport system ATPase subunit